MDTDDDDEEEDEEGEEDDDWPAPRVGAVMGWTTGVVADSGSDRADATVADGTPASSRSTMGLADGDGIDGGDDDAAARATVGGVSRSPGTVGVGANAVDCFDVGVPDVGATPELATCTGSAGVDGAAGPGDPPESGCASRGDERGRSAGWPGLGAFGNPGAPPPVPRSEERWANGGCGIGV